MRRSALLMVLAACGSSPPPTTKTTAPAPAPTPADPAHHASQMIEVAPGVSLEVLDFGGKGEPIVLLAGLGNTAHVFDDFAPELADHHHVFAITRRGYGRSSGPDTGYDLATRVADDLAVLAGLHLPHAIWIGHSVAGDELTGLGAHPDHATALVYLDAANEHTQHLLDLISGAPDYFPPPPGPDVQRDPVKFTAWRNAGVDLELPLGETLSQLDFAPDGVHPRGREDAADRILSTNTPQDFASVRVPALVLIAVPSGPEEMIFGFEKMPAADQQAWHDKYWATFAKLVADTRADVVAHLKGAKVVDYPHAHHYLFVKSTDKVLADIRAFAP